MAKNNITKKLFLLVLVDEEQINHAWNKNWGFVIRAGTQKQARKLANKNSADEGKIWEDTTKTDCTEISMRGDNKIILRDFLEY